MRDQNGEKFLQYSEDCHSKANQGGLKHKWIKPKVVKAYGNSNTDRDLVRLYEKYCSLLPADPKSSALYKYPLCPSKRSPKVWFTDKPLGVNKVREIVKNLMKSVGIQGRFTNHSLRVSAASRMFSRGIDEQVIKERTGHRSDAVRSYKRTDEALLRNAEMATVGDLGNSKFDPKVWEDNGDIVDKVKLEENTMSYTVAEGTAHDSHKACCPAKEKDGSCPKICEFLKALDSKKKGVKRLSVSLKLK